MVISGIFKPWIFNFMTRATSLQTSHAWNMARFPWHKCFDMPRCSHDAFIQIHPHTFDAHDACDTAAIVYMVACMHVLPRLELHDFVRRKIQIYCSMSFNSSDTGSGVVRAENVPWIESRMHCSMHSFMVTWQEKKFKHGDALCISDNVKNIVHILDRNINRAGQVWATKLFRYIERVKGWDQKGSLHAMHACVRCARHRRSCVMRGSVNICLERIIRKQSMQNHMAYSKHTKNQPHACPCKLLSTNHEWFSNFTIHGFHRAKLYIYIYLFFTLEIFIYIFGKVSVEWKIFRTQTHVDKRDFGSKL